MATHSSTLAWRIPTDRRALEGYSPWGCNELDTTETRTTEYIIYNTIYTYTALFVFYIFVLLGVKFMNIPALCTILRDTSIRNQAPK